MTLHLHLPPEPLDRPAAPLINRCAELTGRLINALTAEPDHDYRAVMTSAAIQTIGDAIAATLDIPETQH